MIPAGHQPLGLDAYFAGRLPLQQVQRDPPQAGEVGDPRGQGIKEQPSGALLLAAAARWRSTTA